MNKRFCTVAAAILVCITFLFGLAGEGYSSAVTGIFTADNTHLVGCCFVLRDDQGRVITEVSRRVYFGDEVILPDGRHYRVIKVRENTAAVKLLGYDKNYLQWMQYFKNMSVKAAAENWYKRPVGIYHTHTDESYKPTSGAAQEPAEGDIYQVGQQFADSLRNKGVNVLYYKTPHDPHDSNAYVRSRRTAVGLIKNNPVALFDIHRDGVPNAGKYRAIIDGRPVAKVRLVIGKQNPKISANLDFAKRLMAYANQLHPGIIKDIYLGRGNYNQDLLSTAIILEAGTYTNTLEEAKVGVALLADAVPVVLGLTAKSRTTAAGPMEQHGKNGWAAAGWLIVITVLLVGVFLLINNGSLEETLETAAAWVKEKLSSPEVKSALQRLAAAVEKINRRAAGYVIEYSKHPAVQRLLNGLYFVIHRAIVAAAKQPARKPEKTAGTKKNKD
ncbi:stage II sporulation protein P [Desulfohalotomaculum tongense]|uniref:stage II sporulation protein P n=1 Tax=Desulforadius tongensis TaxID=1216062 RepID=UPI00195949ED|nr:stage II sporulation protein P [Desulforadius tongensis]MBM7854639.1 stage II sporulation protein P [Desulforadius tongensis]